MNIESIRYQFRNHFKVIPPMALLGVRGYSDNTNPTDIYNDAIIRVIEGEFFEFMASVDPGAYYISHPMNPMGCARLKAGLYSYKLGEHLSNPALVQADEVNVDRLDKDGKKVGEESGHFAINIHSGGPEYLVGRYSAGCQVIKTKEPWKAEWLDFFTPIQVGCGIFKQTTIPYLLVDALEAMPVSG